MRPLLSVVIATKNREEYCMEAIRSILQSMPANVEITVADNSDSSRVKQYVEFLADHRVVYRHDPSPISSIENFNRAMSLATGEYVCMIGDDDTVMWNIVEETERMKRMGIESLCARKNVEFYWPLKTVGRSTAGRILIPEYTGGRERMDVAKTLKQLIQDGIINYQHYGLPRVYHGIVKMDLMNEVKRLTGHYFGGLTPDIFSTVALSCLVQSHEVVDYPFTIPGACATSTSVANLHGGHSGELSSAPHLKNRGYYVWEQVVPAYYSVETIWAETALKALRELERSDLYRLFGSYRLAAHGLFANRKFIPAIALRETLKLGPRIPGGTIVHAFRFALAFARYMTGVLAAKLVRSPEHRPVKVITQVNDLDAVLSTLRSELKAVHE